WRFPPDSRYLTVIDETRGQGYECPGLELVAVEGSYDAKLAEVLDGQSWTRVGFEATDLTVARHTWLTKTVAIELVATEGVVERARVVKDDYEIATLREAGRRLSRVADHVPNEVRIGRTEREVAMAIDSCIRGAGFERTAFDTIVAGGPNAALPHAKPGER